MERHAASAAEELGCRSGAQTEANLRVTPSWFISALCVHWCSILCVRLFVQWSLGLNLCASLFSSTLVCWHASTLACILVWQAHFHIKSVPSAFPSFYFRVQFQIFVSSGAEWSRSLYSFMRRGHAHCIYCHWLAEWFGSLWAYQSSCFSLHQPGRLLSDEYMNSFDFRWKWSHEIFTQVCNMCT